MSNDLSCITAYLASIVILSIGINERSKSEGSGAAAHPRAALKRAELVW
jgi:hypothetical protein